MEILFDSYSIKDSARKNLEGWIRKTFLDIVAWWSVDKRACETEIKGQKSNTQQIYNKSNYKLPILNDFVNKAIEQQKNKNVGPRAMRGENSLIKSKKTPDLF